MKIQRSAVVDEPQLAVPHEHVGVAGGTVHIHQQAVEPHDLGSQAGIHGRHKRIEGERAGQVVHGQVEARAEPQQILNFFVGLGATKGFVELGKDDFGYPQPKQPGYFAADEFGDERFDALPCPPEFEDVEEAVVGFGEGR